MKKILLILMFAFAGCSKNEDSPCTKQNTNTNEIIISCKTLRNENPAVCSRSAINQSTSASEICQLGFDLNCSPAKMIPSIVKTNVDNGTLVLINKSSGKKLILKEYNNGTEVFLILQQEGDVGFTSSVTLPACGS